jgi:myo-inositol 2-dehydrogenase/D-chiro-inositol 1-dehydrogenase
MAKDAGFGAASGPEGPVVRIGVIGCGRIGRMHAEIIARDVPGLTLGGVADVIQAAADGVSAVTGAPVMTIDQILASPDIDAVAICSSTDTHVDYIVAAAEAGKPIFCEKPVSLNLAEVERGVAAVESAGVPFMIGFNRRFDPGHRSVREAVADHTIGDLHLVRITSRDPAPPPVEYVAVSGGIFMDMMIHDFDIARFVAGSDVVEVYARGAVRVDPKIGEAGDVDTAVVILTHADGTFTTIDNSREAVYGYDQRLEAFGSGGMATSDNQSTHYGSTMTKDGARSEPLAWFFLDRYMPAYRREWAAFREYLVARGPSPAGGNDAIQVTKIAMAAALSMREDRPVKVSEIS